MTRCRFDDGVQAAGMKGTHRCADARHAAIHGDADLVRMRQTAEEESGLARTNSTTPVLTWPYDVTNVRVCVVCCTEGKGASLRLPVCIYSS